MLAAACCLLPLLYTGGSFGGPIRSRLVGDGSLPDEPPIVLAPQRGPPPEPLARTSSWRPGAEGSTPPDHWNGTTSLVSSGVACFHRGATRKGSGSTSSCTTHCSARHLALHCVPSVRCWQCTHGRRRCTGVNTWQRLQHTLTYRFAERARQM